MRRRRSALGITVAVALLGAVLAPPPAASAAAAGQCPVSALAKVTKPVEVVFWHAMTQANEDALERLTDRFNASQSKVQVKLVSQATYDDAFTKYRAGLATGNLPDLVQLPEYTLQQMIDTRSIVPAGACVAADRYDLSDHLERVVDYYTVGGTLQAMPFNVSNPVFYYNKKAFAAAGLDPERPPATLDEVKAAAEKLVRSGATRSGYGLKTDPWYLEQWFALANRPFVNNGNGRSRRATAVRFDTPLGRELFAWMSDMVASKLAVPNVDVGGTAVDNLLGIGSGALAMTVDTSAALGTITNTLRSGLFPNVELGVGPMVGPGGNGGILVGGGALYLSKYSSSTRRAAAWEYAKFLNQPDVQAEWAAATGYVPIRRSSIALPAVQQLWARTPGYKVAYDQLVSGEETVATAGPVIGDYLGVRAAVRDAEQSMFVEGRLPDAALETASRAANAAITKYNRRVGG
jgi:sn-glycerol 3-phosphate transport system substrate-binding protein